MSRLTIRELLAFLADSDYLSDLDYICECFDRRTKPRFNNENNSQVIKFGSAKDNDADLNISFGQLKMTGKEVAQFFEPSVQCIIHAVKAQIEKSSCKITVGLCFLFYRTPVSTAIHSMSSLLEDSQPAIGSPIVSGTSSYLEGSLSSVQSTTRNDFSPFSVSAFTDLRQSNKAVSDGSVSFSLDHHVKARVAKLTYGKKTCMLYNPRDPDHFSRQDNVFRDIDGRRFLPSVFSLLLVKVRCLTLQSFIQRSDCH